MKYYLLKTDVFPHEFADGESVVLIHDEEDGGDIGEIDLEFMSTLVIKSTESEKTIKEFYFWWSENTTGKVEIDLLTEEISHLNDERRSFVNSLQEDEWSLKDNFVAYVKSDPESQQYAKEMIIESELILQ